MGTDVQLIEVNPATPVPERSPVLDVIFIHGLGGHHEETWKPESGEIWPQRVANKHPQVQVWSLQYPAIIGELVGVGEVDQPDLNELAVLAAKRMQNRQIGAKPCIWVCHSLGGLLAKRILLDAWECDQSRADRLRHENVRALMFCGTPHRGSELADVLKGIERVKEVALKNVLPFLGSISDTLGKLLSKGVARTSDLIDLLRSNDLVLQHLNEDFGRYYQMRAQSSDFLVDLYVETERQKVRGVPTLLVVRRRSGDAYLRNGPARPIQPLPVPGKDHGTLVKPDSELDWVVDGLNGLIATVGGGTFPAADIQDRFRRRIAMLLHAALLETPALLEFFCFRRWIQAAWSDADRPVLLARELAKCDADEMTRQIGLLMAEFDRIPTDRGLASAMHDALTKVGCILLLAFMRVENATARVSGQALKIDLPRVSDHQDFEVMVEVLHAALRDWPLRLQLDDNRVSVRSGNRILRPAAKPVGSWRNDDHLRHLVDRILAARTIPHRQLGGFEDCPGVPDVAPGTVSEVELREAKQMLKIWLANNLGLVIDAMQGSSDEPNPYHDQTMQEMIDQAFGDLIALVLPAQDESHFADALERLPEFRATAQQLLLRAVDSRSRLSS